MEIMEKKMETTIVYWGCMGIMEKKMEIIIMGYIGYVGNFLGYVRSGTEVKMEISLIGLGFRFAWEICWG